mmetsp:Transcript_21699/g.30421  ORF Transcript_21699/g.30421 Transcript_21699/m.30421 type:complete len:414 (-) Transcript_21699:22-1263(-)
MVLYGQVILGPPGSGKTTYCDGMQQYLRLIGRDALVVNLDPANEVPRVRPAMNNTVRSSDNEGMRTSSTTTETDATTLPYETILDVCEDVICLSSVMSELNLGPNGGLLYCMEYVEHHLEEVLDLLQTRLDSRTKSQGLSSNSSSLSQPYLLIDLPGQVELYTHCTCVQSILSSMGKRMDARLVSVHLVDAHSCTDAAKFVSAAVLSTSAMIRLELPAVNVLSKVDLLSQYGDSMPFALEYFAECHDLSRLVDYLEQDRKDGDGIVVEVGSDKQKKKIYTTRTIADDPEYQEALARRRNTTLYKKHRRLHESLCELVEDFSLLQYMPLNINDAESVGRVVARIDRSNGYVFAVSAELNYNQQQGNTAREMFNCAMTSDQELIENNHIADIQERYISSSFLENIPELTSKTNNT